MLRSAFSSVLESFNWTYRESAEEVEPLTTSKSVAAYSVEATDNVVELARRDVTSVVPMLCNLFHIVEGSNRNEQIPRVYYPLYIYRKHGHYP